MKIISAAIITLLTLHPKPLPYQPQQGGACRTDTIPTIEQTTKEKPQNLKTLDSLTQAADKAYYNTGICVWDLTTDTLLYAYNANKVMRPASTQKLLTAITALNTLGAQHQIQTKTYYTGNITPDGTLNGDIYVVGDFDPLYTLSDLKQLAHTISNQGIKHVNGKLYGDPSMKNNDLYGNGWCWDDVPSTNQPYLSALMLERGKESPRFNTYSKDPHFNPANDFVKTLSTELKKLGITTTHPDHTNIPYAIHEMTTHGNLIHTQTHTIEDILQRMMKNSDNLHAEAAFYHIANTLAPKHCTWKHGASKINQTLTQAGADITLGEIADGSGVSLYNYVSPANQTAMLRFAYNKPHIFPYLYNSLPIAGCDGTLENRMKTGPAHNNVRAKTGTVAGCSCLAGYVRASNGHLLAFSIMNNGVMSSQTGRHFQDQVCQALAQ